MAEFQLFLLGWPRLVRDQTPVDLPLRKALALLSYLAVTAPEAHSRDALATLFWPEHNQSRARTNLRRTLFELNHQLGALLHVESERISLRVDAPLWLDVAEFQQQLATAGAPASLAHLTAAVDLYTADFMAGFTLPDCPAFDTWQFFQVERLQQLLNDALVQLIQCHEAQGSHSEALSYARRWLALDPLHEAAHRQLMRTYALAGQLPAALRQYESCVRLLQEELNAAPEAETITLYETIRARRLPTAARIQPTMAAQGRVTSDKVTNDKVTNDKVTNDKVTNDKVTNDKMTAQDHPVILSSCHLVTPTIPHNLPAQPTPFIGRRQELATILQQLNDSACRLLTLVGPGGIGKTRLAVQVAQAILDVGFTISDLTPRPLPDDPTSNIQHPNFPDGVFFVTLQPVESPNEIVPAIAEAVGIHFAGSEPALRQLIGALQGKQVLIVLDNFEHLLAGAALLAELLAATTGVKLVVTSRLALNLVEEWFHPLAGLPLPMPGATGYPWETALAESDAVRLFVQSARRAQPGFDLATEAAHVLRICQVVDGMPLALELAASWLRVLPCAQIAAELAHNLDLLTARHHNLPTRHRSMRVVLEQSWRMLTAEEQRVLEKLAVFRGGFTAQAAAQVAGAALPVLATLVEQALVWRRPAADGEERYHLHELLRQFAEEGLKQTPELAQHTYAAHAAYFAHWLHGLEPRLFDERQMAAYAAIQRELHNLTQAWSQIVAHGPVGLIGHFLEGICGYYILQGQIEQAFDFLARVIERLRAEAATGTPVAATLSYALAWQTAFLYGQGDTVRGESTARESLQLAQQAGDARLTVNALDWLARIAGVHADFDGMQRLIGQALDLARAERLDLLEARLLSRLADRALAAGQYGAARTYQEQALAIYHTLHHYFYIDLASGDLAATLRQLGDYAEAQTLLHAALALQEKMGSRLRRHALCYDLGAVAQALGQYEEAQHYYEQSLAAGRAAAVKDRQIQPLLGLADLARIRGDYHQGCELLQRVDQLLQGNSKSPLQAEARYHRGLLALGQNDLLTAEAHFAQSYTLSQAANLPIAAALALRGLGQAAQGRGERRLAQERYLAALGQVQTIQAIPVVLEILLYLGSNGLAQGAAHLGLFLLAFVAQSAAAPHEVRHQAQALWLVRRAAYDRATVKAAEAEAATATVDRVVATLLGNEAGAQGLLVATSA
jgi:DNA-binding SARP family transcriptional activator/predicted ATPase